MQSPCDDPESDDEDYIIAQYKEGQREDDDGLFEEMIGEAAGLIAIPLDAIVDDTRDKVKRKPHRGQPFLFTDLS